MSCVCVYSSLASATFDFFMKNVRVPLRVSLVLEFRLETPSLQFSSNS